MRDIDRELDAVERAMAAENVAPEPQVKSDLWRIVRSIVPWAIIAAVVFIVFRIVER